MTVLTLKNISDKKFEPLNTIFELGIISSNVWLAGGSLQVLANPKVKVNDFDLFFKEKGDVERVKDVLEREGYTQTFACPAGELFTYRREDEPKVQLITKFFYKGMKELIKSFDFTVAMWATDGDVVITTCDAIKDTIKMEININEVSFPVATMNRMFRYRDKKGFNLSPDTMVDFIQAVNQGEFDEDQLALYID